MRAVHFARKLTRLSSRQAAESLHQALTSFTSIQENGTNWTSNTQECFQDSEGKNIFYLEIKLTNHCDYF